MMEKEFRNISQKKISNDLVCGEVNRFYKKKRKERPSFSKRAFAKSLGLSPTFVHDILSGKKQLPAKHFSKVVAALDIDSNTALEMKRSYLAFEELGSLNSEKRQSSDRTDWQLGLSTQREMLRNWYFLPMLELMTLDGFKGDFAERLGISKDAAEYALKRFKALGLAEYRNGRWIKKAKLLKFLSSMTQSDFRAFHRSMVNKVLTELEKSDAETVNRRLVTGATFTIDSRKLSLIKEKLNNFLNEISEECAAEDGDSVYSLNVQLVPLSK